MAASETLQAFRLVWDLANVRGYKLRYSLDLGVEVQPLGVKDWYYVGANFRAVRDNHVSGRDPFPLHLPSRDAREALHRAAQQADAAGEDPGGPREAGLVRELDQDGNPTDAWRDPAYVETWLLDR